MMTISRELEKRHEDLQLNGEFDNKTPDEQHEILNEYGYVMSSGKMVLLDKLLPKLRAEGHKVLIFRCVQFGGFDSSIALLLYLCDCSVLTSCVIACYN